MRAPPARSSRIIEASEFATDSPFSLAEKTSSSNVQILADVDIAKAVRSYSQRCIELAGHVLIGNECGELDDRLIIEVPAQIRNYFFINLAPGVSHFSRVIAQ